MTDHVTPQEPAGTPVLPPEPTAPPEPAAPAGPALSEVEPVAPPSAAPETPEEREARLARRTRRRRAVVRWAAATLVCALAGTGTAMALTAPERTDIPGLATKSDGRYTFPALALPPRPPAKGPSVRKDREPHRADLRHLVLPAPKEAGGPLGPVVFPSPTATPSASGSASPSAAASASPTASASSSGSASPSSSAKAGAATADWAPCDAVLDEQQNPDAPRALLLQNACRAGAVREWTASDGTRTQIRLLRFGSYSECWDVFSGLRADSLPKALPGAKTGSHDGWDTLPNVDLAVKESSVQGDKGVPTARVAYLGANDVLAVVTMTNPKGVPVAPFRQVVTLQSDLLN
ncbi:hypothetical protein PUR71_22930 [Streptomyces sp. SP17BM10]|uniref:hypothetical protein n=1 Tax=Streptomyces sp. SP17BM10 TaxID=3002530 RepID=UPI002E7A1114|nr:hypothetical protein [Streptomyces sp. SP17BM10]MEE1785735.1 hypothetical protein [Streptomyces sp. SP17BM10]